MNPRDLIYAGFLFVLGIISFYAPLVYCYGTCFGPYAGLYSYLNNGFAILLILFALYFLLRALFSKQRRGRR